MTAGSEPRAEFDAEPYQPGAGGAAATAVRAELESRVEDIATTLGELVSIESPSDDRACLDVMAERIEALFHPFGTMERIEGERGTHLRLSTAGSDARRPTLVLCHYDTVWPKGTLQTIPFSIDEQGVARGPGCFDMKGGIVALLFALRGLAACGLELGRPARVLFTCDEEVGSVTSRGLIEEEARHAGLALVLESPLAGGTLKTARKGTGDYLLTVEGKAAHAGVEPWNGINALHEMAYQVLALQALNDFEAGTTLNVGVARGGTRPNVVPAWAEAEIDVRVASLAEAERLDGAVRSLVPRLAGARLHISGGLNRPPMERSAAMARLFQRARSIAAAMGITDLKEGATGGGSDGNFTAALGVPTLDGLGPEGDGAHAAHEQVLVASFPRRAALLAGLLAEV